MPIAIRSFFRYTVLLISVLSNFSFAESHQLDIKVPRGVKVISVPFPQEELMLDSKVSVSLDARILPANISYSLLWPQKDETPRSIRVLNIEFDEIPVNSSLVSLKWQVSDRLLKKSQLSTMLNAQMVYPDLNWLRRVLLLTNNNGVEEGWYRDIQKLTAIYLADETLLAKKGYPKSVASQWLYDKPQAFYQLFLTDGDHKFKRQADRYVAFYKNQIDAKGYFKLSKPKDIKYLMGRSLVYSFLLNQNYSSLETLERMFNASLDWPSTYSGKGFWTERHHAAAMNIAISFWEVSGREDAKKRVDELVEGIFQMTFSPHADWPVRGCPQHTFNSHEGWGDNTPACSPWMMALIADNLWRYYLLTSDKKSSLLLSSFVDFLLVEGTYIANEGKIKGHLVPKYLVSLDNSKQEELDPWSDREHTCDVAAMVGKGVFIKRQLGKDYLRHKKLFNQLSGLCKLKHLAIVEKYKYVKLTQISSKPPRKFNWQYSSTDDLPWLMQVLNAPSNTSVVEE